MTAKELKQTIRSEIEQRIREINKTIQAIGKVDSPEAIDHRNELLYRRDTYKECLSFIDSLPEVEIIPREESLKSDVEAAMKNLDEKIKLTKEHGSWKGVDVDKFMDEVRGRDQESRG